MDSQNIGNGKNLPEVFIYDTNTNRQLKVGELFVPDVTSWPVGVTFNYTNSGLDLMLNFKTPTKMEIDGVSNGEIDLRLYIEKEIIDLVFRFGDAIPWSDAPFNWHKNPQEYREIPPVLDENVGAFLNIFLIDSSTGILKALRVIQVGHEFARKLFEAVQEQIQMPYDKFEYMEHIKLMNQKFMPKDLALRSKIKLIVNPMATLPNQILKRHRHKKSLS